MSNQDQPRRGRRHGGLRISWPVLRIASMVSSTMVPWLVFMYLASR